MRSIPGLATLELYFRTHSDAGDSTTQCIELEILRFHAVPSQLIQYTFFTAYNFNAQLPRPINLPLSVLLHCMRITSKTFCSQKPGLGPGT